MYKRKSTLHNYWKDWCWSWSFSTLATWCDELTHWKRPWCWERLKTAGEGDDRGWDDWMASLTQWTWVWASSRSWWWTGKPGMLQGLQRVRHDWVPKQQQQVYKSNPSIINTSIINIIVYVKGIYTVINPCPSSPRLIRESLKLAEQVGEIIA